MKKIIAVWTGIFCLISPLRAETLSLIESIKFALENNKMLLSVEKNIEAEKDLKKMALSGIFPKASLRGGYTLWEDLMEILIKRGEMGEFMGLEVPPEDTIATFDFTYDYMVQVEAVQPVFTWGKILFSYLGANENVKAKKEEYKQKREELIAQTIKAFYSVLLAEEYQKLMEDALAISEDHLRVVKARYKAGEVTDYELLRAEVEVANLRPQVIEARNSYKLALLAYRKVIGVPLEKEVYPEGSLEDVGVKVEGDLENFLRVSMENRPELKVLSYYEKALDYSIKVKVGEYLPNFAISLNYTVQTNRPRGRWFRGGTLLFGFDWNVFDGLLRVFEIERLKAQKESLHFTKKEIEDLVKLEVENAYKSFKAAKEMIKASKETVNSARRGMEIAKVRYKSGLMTNIEFLDAQLAWKRAKLNYLKTLFDYINAIVNLYRACGIMNDFVKNLQGGRNEN